MGAHDHRHPHEHRHEHRHEHGHPQEHTHEHTRERHGNMTLPGATAVTNIVEGPITPHDAAPTVEDGAALTFAGHVRDTEHGREIVSLDYEYYEGMAQVELQALAEDTLRRFPVRRLQCTHRVGRVPVGEAALLVTVHSPHRAEGLAAVAWFIRELKDRVPIWKWAVTPDGERFPAPCSH
ncbi:molybdenum cofactor biosynthesis protein MoaE [bacterium]|nr:molybdenum cofactor biosynthesis protein MoaE [bacterium]